MSHVGAHLRGAMRNSDWCRLAELRNVREVLGDIVCCVALTVTGGLGYMLLAWQLSWMLTYRW